MPIDLHALMVPFLVRGLHNLTAVLKKGEAHAKDNNMDPQDLITARLYPDMGDLPFQIQRATNAARFLGEHIAGAEPVSVPYTDTTFAELYERIAGCITWLEGLDPATFAGKEDGVVEVRFGSEPGGKQLKCEFTPIEYLTMYGGPNFWFHCTTAYGILRSKGVPVGKLDFLNGSGLQEGIRVVEE
ncbi:hypothetical protein EJ04DRAFT_508122 [Polyplosphaeria fusca]|uniref:DUF1993 domain-containing protein n=1 Tax=Polyplosphaeria fusca TaxID=682080 RepID=A0A9P4RAX3_9PLEO|nr:hypothetical protein EJ04DRAFT_508122 [Polyplosphaeria fusca]